MAGFGHVRTHPALSLCLCSPSQGGRMGNHVTRSSSGDLSEPGNRLGGRAGSTSSAVSHAVGAQSLAQPPPHHPVELQPVPQPIANGTALPAAQKAARTAAEGATPGTASAASLSTAGLKGLSKEKRNAKLGERAAHVPTLV